MDGAAAAEHGVPLERVMMVGDGTSGLEVMQAVGFPVAMGNAAPEILALAHHQAGHVDAGGLIEALKPAMRLQPDAELCGGSERVQVPDALSRSTLRSSHATLPSATPGSRPRSLRCGAARWAHDYRNTLRPRVHQLGRRMHLRARFRSHRWGVRDDVHTDYAASRPARVRSLPPSATLVLPNSTARHPVVPRRESSSHTSCRGPGSIPRSTRTPISRRTPRAYPPEP